MAFDRVVSACGQKLAKGGGGRMSKCIFLALLVYLSCGEGEEIYMSLLYSCTTTDVTSSCSVVRGVQFGEILAAALPSSTSQRA